MTSAYSIFSNRPGNISGRARQQAGKFMRLCLLPVLVSFASGCSYFSKTVTVESENQNSRVSIIVVHHTAIDFGRSLEVLTKTSSNPVSSHYLVPEPNDASYPKSRLKTYKLVEENKRAWHAGRSYWRGKEGLNDQSIGIEIVNVPDCQVINNPTDKAYVPATERVCFFPDFPWAQMKLVEELLIDILKRHPHISPLNIVAHSDIAPSRKNDPGPRFPWERLYQLGIGAWYDNDTVVKYMRRFREQELPVDLLQEALNTYGYGIEITGEMDEQTKMVVSAFQLHFDQANVSGAFTPQTTAKLFALIEKYLPRKLPDLMAKANQQNP